MHKIRQAVFLSPASASRRLRISIKTLKVYERYGLVSPKRTPSGWRLYAKEDVERLLQALSYKAMGFSLAQIASLLDGSPADVAAALRSQETSLQARRDALDASIEALRAARRRVGRPALRLVA